MNHRGGVPAALCALTVLVSGCGLTDTVAERDAREQAKQLGREMTIRPVRDASTMDLMRRGSDFGDVTFLQADGVPRDNNAVIVARIHTEYVSSGFAFSAESSEATLCFEYHIDQFATDAERPKQIDCPATEPLVVSTPEPEPQLPPDAVERVTAALTALKKPAGAVAVQEAALKAMPDGSWGVHGTTAGVWTGLSLEVGSDCLLARVRENTVEVWIPPAVTIQPGELTCSSDTAAHGLAKRPPH